MTSLSSFFSSAAALPAPEAGRFPQRPDPQRPDPRRPDTQRPDPGHPDPRHPGPKPAARALRRGLQAGFTLLEILVVLVIIGLLAGLVGPRLLSQLDRAKITTAETQIRMLKGALETMRLDLGRFPSAEEGLALLTTPPADGALRQRWRGPYLDGQVPIDPWVNPYQYDPRGRDTNPFALYSFGPDGPSAPASAYIGFPPPSG